MPTAGASQPHEIGQVILALGVIGPYLMQPAKHIGRGRVEDTGVAQRLGAFGVCRVNPFNCAFNTAVVQDDAAVLSRINRTERE